MPTSLSDSAAFDLSKKKKEEEEEDGAVFSPKMEKEGGKRSLSVTFLSVHAVINEPKAFCFILNVICPAGSARPCFTKRKSSFAFIRIQEKKISKQPLLNPSSRSDLQVLPVKVEIIFCRQDFTSGVDHAAKYL